MSTTNELRRQQTTRRRERLAELIRLHFGGRQSGFVDKIEGNQGEISALIGNEKKSFGALKARGLEQKAGLLAGSLDASVGSPFYPVSRDQTGNDLSDADKTKAPGKITHPLPLMHAVGESKNFRRVYVIGRAQGGLPERIWTDGDHLVGAIDEYAELATTDPQAFICPVVGDSMYPRFMPGEYVLVEPGTPPQIEGTVLVRLTTGETILKRLLSRRDAHVRLGSWNDPIVHTFRESEITWMYYVAHAVPPEKIKTRF
ncbi:S24 family peptidase [Paraburkholderia sediminicola]|uniref:S24 family peptidase n=1 Tax=Paraburkholderia sediminicola TaxID=458836 RepID=UPI0038B78916